MTQEEILEYNKMCAEFLGWTIDQDEILTVPEECKVKPQIYWPAYKNLLFHSDWNWIKSVLEKISSLNEEGFSDDAAVAFDDLLDLSIFSSKEAVVQAINQFLIWYNEQRT